MFLLVVIAIVGVVVAEPPVPNTYLPPAAAAIDVAQQESLETAATNTNAAAKILKFENEREENKYRFAYETGNDIKHEEMGELKDNDVLVVEGSYSYVGPDGVTYTVHYVADENGFRPTGDHIPAAISNAAAAAAERTEPEGESSTAEAEYKGSPAATDEASDDQTVIVDAVQPQRDYLPPNNANHHYQQRAGDNGYHY